MTVSVFVAKLSNLASAAVFEKVRDWTLSGLVRESIWIDVDEPQSVIRVRNNGHDKVDTQAWMATSPGSLKFYALQILKNEGSKVSGDQVIGALNTVPAFKPFLAGLVNLIFPLSESKNASEVLFRDNLNVVSIPSDSFGPNSSPLELNNKSTTYFSNCSKELVTISGLWPGQQGSMLDDIQLTVGSPDNVLIERSFVRYVDASEFVKSVIDKVIDGDGKTLATPVDVAGQPIDVITGPAAETTVNLVVDQFIAAHPQLQFTPVQQGFSRRPIAAGFIKLLAYYFTWVGKWIIRQPGNILQKAIANKKLAIAKRVQEMFGERSQFMVLVGGVSAHQYPNGIPLVADSIMETVQQQLKSPVIPAPAAPGVIWKNLVDVATSLADGAPVAIDGVVMPAHEGRGRRVITNPDLITPNYSDKFFEIPAGLNVPYKGHRIPPSDPLLARLVQESLNNPQIASSNIAAVNKLQQDLSQWRNANKSFIWRVGDRIADSIFQGLKTWEDLSSQVQDVNTESLIAAEEKAQKSLTRLFKGVFMIVGVSGLLWLAQAIWVNMIYGSWPVMATWWAIPASIVGALVILWNVIGISLMNGAVKELFRLEHEIDIANERVEQARISRVKIWQQISDLTTYYKQYQAWVAVLSSFVHKKPADVAIARDSLAGSQSLPQSLTIASLVPQVEGHQGNFTADVSNKFYVAGWLNNLVINVLNREVRSYNEITADSLATNATPLSQALAWANGGDVHKVIKHFATEQVQALAIAGTAYQSWQVRLKNAVGDSQQINGHDFIGQLGSGDDYLPVGNLLTEAGSVSDAVKVDRSQSACAFDSRLQLSGDLGKNVIISGNDAESRSLDFLGIRFETSKLISPTLLKIFGRNDGGGVGESDGMSSPVTPA